jgi:hypothetical protein
LGSNSSVGVLLEDKDACELPLEVPPVHGSEAEVGHGWGRRIFPGVPSVPSISARESASARVSRSFFVASLGSVALRRIRRWGQIKHKCPNQTYL